MKQFIIAKEMEIIKYFECFDTCTLDIAESKSISEFNFRSQARDLLERFADYGPIWSQMMNFL